MPLGLRTAVSASAHAPSEARVRLAGPLLAALAAWCFGLHAEFVAGALITAVLPSVVRTCSRAAGEWQAHRDRATALLLAEARAEHERKRDEWLRRNKSTGAA